MKAVLGVQEFLFPSCMWELLILQTFSKFRLGEISPPVRYKWGIFLLKHHLLESVMGIN